MFNSKLYFYATVNVYILESINLSLQIFFYFRGSRINSPNGRKKCSSWSRNKKKDFLQKKYFTEECLINVIFLRTYLGNLSLQLFFYFRGSRINCTVLRASERNSRSKNKLLSEKRIF